MDIQVEYYKNLYKEKFQFEDKKHLLIISWEEAGYALN